MAHIISRESTGNGMTDSTTAVCSCGWRGSPHFEHDDYMVANLRADEFRHLAQANATEAALRFAAGIACADTLGSLV